MSTERPWYLKSPCIVGVIHLPPLPHFRGSRGLESVIEKALRDQRALEDGGVHGILVENEEDQPHEVTASAPTVAAMTRVALELVRASRRAIPGVEILLNDPKASIAAARAAGARFVRTDYFVDRMERPEYGGEMAIDPNGLMGFRDRIGASGIAVFADIQVKYARMIEPRPLAESARLAAEHHADAIVVTGTKTGEPPSLDDVRQAKAGAGKVPVWLGSGLDEHNAEELMSLADGAIVGTSLKTGAYVDPVKTRRLMEAVARARRGH
ncbi:MAG: BtpA/SgcQ family protein [Bdellovibrionales bacterium]|nr:BtpA/SgcQ family protein [Bdellovibrionales bacterium]